jgi:hypothetical protein
MKVKRWGQNIKNKEEWAKGKEGEGCLRDISKKKHELTNFMELSPSSEAVSCAATKEIPKILCNPKVHYRVHKSPHWSLS